MYRQYRAVLSPKLSRRKGERYVIVDTQTGEIVDDCQGYGYKTPRRAYACFGYKKTHSNEGSFLLKKASLSSQVCLVRLESKVSSNSLVNSE